VLSPVRLEKRLSHASSTEEFLDEEITTLRCELRRINRVKPHRFRGFHDPSSLPDDKQIKASRTLIRYRNSINTDLRHPLADLEHQKDRRREESEKEEPFDLAAMGEKARAYLAGETTRDGTPMPPPTTPLALPLTRPPTKASTSIQTAAVRPRGPFAGASYVPVGTVLCRSAHRLTVRRPGARSSPSEQRYRLMTCDPHTVGQPFRASHPSGAGLPTLRTSQPLFRRVTHAPDINRISVRAPTSCVTLRGPRPND